MKELIFFDWRVREISGIPVGVERVIDIICDSQVCGEYTEAIVHLDADCIKEEKTKYNRGVLTLIAAAPEFLRIAHRLSKQDRKWTDEEREIVSLYNKIMNS